MRIAKQLADALRDCVDLQRTIGLKDDETATLRNSLAALAAYDGNRRPAAVRMVCATCGSEDVRADTFAAWDFDAQDWRVSAVMDEGHCCEDCGGECRIEEVRA